MSEKEGGAIGKIWRRNGRGFYAFLAIGTFLYLEVMSVIGSFGQAEGVEDFVKAELMESLLTFGLETFLNSLLAGIWPFIWIRNMGVTSALLWSGGGYLLWAVVLAAILDHREKAFRKELGI